MTRIFLPFFLVAGAIAGPTIHHEATEWTDIWISHANQDNLPRCIMIGDSIVRGYYDLVSKQLTDKFNCTKFATSTSVADPAFCRLLEAVLHGYNYDVIHLNNGLHGWDYTEEEYRSGYEAVVRLIKARASKAKLVFALSTPLKPTGRDKTRERNRRILARNEIVRQLAAKYGAVVNDLHRVSSEHPETYRGDGVHYNGKGRELQAKQVVSYINSQLRKQK